MIFKSTFYVVYLDFISRFPEQGLLSLLARAKKIIKKIKK
jgi:hypothetical protein